MISEGPVREGACHGPCPVCGIPRQTWLSGFPAVCSCPSCTLLSLGENPARPPLDELYEENYYDGETGDRFLGLFEKAVAVFHFLRVRAILRREPGPGNILDVGCGRGDLLEIFRKRGWHAVGTQISRTAAEAARRRRGVTVLVGDLPDLDLSQGSFRVVTFFHVLEHLENPVAYLEKSYEILERNGLLVIEVPNHGGPGFRLLGRRHFCFDYPNHKLFFSFPSLINLAAKTGFTLQERSHFSLEYSPFSTLQNMLNLLPGPPNILYRALMLNSAGGRLRRSPWTWVHFFLALVLSMPAFFLAAIGLFFPVGNTMRLYLRKSATSMAAGQAGYGTAGSEAQR